MEIKWQRLSPLATMPYYASDGAAAMDLCAALEAPVTLLPGERIIIPTGLAMEIPVGGCAFLLARSGLSVKKGITLTNGVGLIDSDYRGDLGVGLLNVSQEPYTISNGERIAQLCIMQAVQVQMQEVDDLTPTERGTGGFGSTGK